MTNETPVVEQKIIQVSFWKAISIVSGAILISIVGTAFTIGSVLNSDHFTLATATADITSLKNETVKKDIYELQFSQITEQLNRIERKMDQVTTKSNP